MGKGTEEQPWLEKYRPQQIKDIVGNEETVGRLEVLAQQGNMPNLILSGPPGTGKTTAAESEPRTAPRSAPTLGQQAEPSDASQETVSAASKTS